MYTESGSALLYSQLSCFSSWVRTCAKDREPLEKYVSSGGRFTVMLPKRVGTEADTVDTKLGQLHVHMIKARSKFIQFLISHTDYPQEYIDDMGAGQFLLKSAEGVADNFGGTTTGQKSFIQKDNAVHEVTSKRERVSIFAHGFCLSVIVCTR